MADLVVVVVVVVVGWDYLNSDQHNQVGVFKEKYFLVFIASVRRDVLTKFVKGRMFCLAKTLSRTFDKRGVLRQPY